MLDLYAKPRYKMKLLERIKWWTRRAKHARQRARWGFCEYDAWNMDVYLAELIGDMLLYRAKYSNTYFNNMTEEEIQQWFIDTAQMFKDYNRDCPGDYLKEVHDQESFNIWKKKEEEFRVYKKERLTQGFTRLNNQFEQLWD